jgi:murein DD-endopeptidase MepM/ murein hydrolase activator NlpD
VRRSRWFGTVVSAALAGALACPAPVHAADELPDTPAITAAKARLAGLQAQGRRVAEQLAAALREIQRLDGEITALEVRIPLLVAADAHFHDVLTRRAVEMYMYHSTHEPRVVLQVLRAPDVVTAARTIELADHAQTAEIELALEAQDHLAAVEGLLEEYRKQQEQQVHAVALLQAAQVALDRRTAQAAATVRQLEAEEARRQYELALLRLAEAEQAGAAAAEPPPPPPAVEVQSNIADADAAKLVPLTELICPIAGPVTFSNDWGQPRSGWRFHSGTDLFSPGGTPNVAVASGIARQAYSEKGGRSVWLEADHGVHYYYAHLDGWAGEFPGGARRVAQGEAIGYTGATGNAAGGAPHTHFQVHPGGGGAVNPYSIVLSVCGG